MKILITGAKGFVGRNLCANLRNIQEGKDRRFPDLKIDEIFEYDLDSTPEELDQWCAEADFVFNLAGVNRPQNQEEFMQGNFGFASTLLDTLKKHGNKCPVMISSSIQATLAGRFGNSEYGRSKKAGEELMFQYGEETGAKVLVYRFPNLFGKWCRPNYNSAVATFCNNIANDLPIQVNDPSVELELLYIDDLVDEMVAALKGEEHRCEFNGLEVIPTPFPPKGEIIEEAERSPLGGSGAERSPSGGLGAYCYCPVTHKVTLGEIVSLLDQFHANGTTRIPFQEISLPLTGMSAGASSTLPFRGLGGFAKKLYSTYLSYLPKEKVAFPLKMNVDDRGSFTELLHTLNSGQVSINISKPGITKGQHWHNTKWEFFIVVAGHGLIQMRAISPLPTSPSRGGDKPWRTADPSLYEQLKEHADRMRKKPTEAEAALWEMLRGKNLDAKFRRQYVIGDYIADFVCLKKQLIIEVDGEYHNSPEQQEMDRWRTNFLQSKGFSVLRFTNNEVLAAPEETMTIIRNALKYLPLEGGSEGGCWFVSGDNIQCVHMLPGYTHNIINLSETENLVTVMYCNEIFNPEKPDTFFEKV